MEEKLGKNDANKIEQKVQKKSEKDKNGIIGGLVFGNPFSISCLSNI